ncbi:MAG TPA: SPOR domain-containing protein [Acidobacteriaceae bacterium]|nr:SPOR domain-containing protein [Acidobacteriaceae bacterium]
MRTLFDTEEEEEVKASEITLSTASLLGIFFGLVLICGVFFGFGYSMGRGTGQKTQAHALENIPANNPSDGDETANAAPPTEAAPAEAPATAKAAPPAVKDDAAPEEDTPAKPEPPANPKPATLKSVPAYVPPVDAPPSASGKPMVQIAAVARPEDAYVLVNALRQRGYSVVVRNEPQDKLLHVQVGPFADLTQATAMKQKLLSDGYNAIIKQ